MIIQSLERGLSVIRKIESSESFEILLCRDLLEEKDAKYLVVCIYDTQLIRNAMPVLVRECGKRSFVDFKECFSQDGKFYCVFRYSEYPSLCDRLSEYPYSLRERLEMGKSLFTQMTELEMSPDLQLEALSSENLLLDDALGMHFNYVLKGIAEYGKDDIHALQPALGELLRKLFDRELVNKESIDIRYFIEYMEASPYDSYLEMYKSYDKLYCKVIDDIENDRIRPNGFLYRLWRKLKGLTKYVRPAIGIFLISAALIYLIWYLSGLGSGDTTSAHLNFDRIGTVEISD